MIRTYARIWIGLMACLFMQAGLLLGSAQARPEDHRAMMSRVVATHTTSDHRDMHTPACCADSSTTPKDHRVSDGCCHTHVLSAHPMLVLATATLARPPLFDTDRFTARSSMPFIGTDRSPGLRPPRPRTI